MAHTYTTNTSLPKPTHVSVIHDDIDLLKDAHAIAMDHLETIFTGTGGPAAAASTAGIINLGGKSVYLLQVTSIAGSISTIAGAIPYRPFTILAVSAASSGNYGITDADPFKITSAWFPNNVGDSITIVWDGTSFIELARNAVA